MRKVGGVIFFLFLIIHTRAQDANVQARFPALGSEENQWVEKIFNTLTLEEKIAQMYMVSAYSGTDKYNEWQIKELIDKYKIGGLIFMQGTATKQAQLTNQFQRSSKVPLLIGMDAEWGLGMRLTGITNLPKQMMLGAMDDEGMVYKMGELVARQCKRLGVHINFAPVVDVNNNPNNPVINFRSFGEDKTKVARFAIQYMLGMQNNGVMACAKHFPGHGDTDVDSHKDLPQINKSIGDLRQTELYPFEQLIRSGVQSIMVAHLEIPSLDNTPDLPTTLSEKVVTGLLKNEMRFRELIITDALNMKGVTKHYAPGEVDLKAFLAGNDILLFSEDVAKGIEKIRLAIQKDPPLENRLNESVLKILHAKYRAGLNSFDGINTNGIDEDINELTSSFNRLVAEKSITLLSDPYNLLDKINRPGSRTAYVGVGISQENDFSRALKAKGISEVFFISGLGAELQAVKSKLKSYDAVIVGIHNMSGYPSNDFGLDKGEIGVVQSLSENKNTVDVLFGNPYAVKWIDNIGSIIVCYEENRESAEAVADLIMGNLPFQGRVPVSIGKRYKAGDGITSLTNRLGERVIRLDPDDPHAIKYRESKGNTDKPEGRSVEVTCCVHPGAVGASIAYLDKVDALMEESVRNRVFPGCRVMAVKDGQVFYDKSFGYTEYDKKVSVDNNTVYDLASVTKVLATTLAVMKLYEQGRIKLDATLATYIPMTRGTNKASLKIKDILLHQAGLKSWIPFYKSTIDDNTYPKREIYSSVKSTLYSVQVAEKLYMNRHYADTIWKQILESPLENRGRYVYSDLDFLFLQKVVEYVTRMPLDEFLRKEFYAPLGLKYTGFNPGKNGLRAVIAPSDYDDYFRHTKTQGYVHDMAAAMLGGVAGHAGLFSTAEEISIILQMLLNGGEYKGKRYFRESTIELFTAKNSFISRRGLGWDKPDPNLKKSQPTGDLASIQSFGHTGFTGIGVWADPKHNLQFIFLSNRTFPDMENKQLWRLNTRERAQDYIYKSFGIVNRN